MNNIIVLIIINFNVVTYVNKQLIKHLANVGGHLNVAFSYIASFYITAS